MTKEKQAEIGILKEIAELLNEGTELQTLLPEVLHKLLDVTDLKMGWIFMVDNGQHRLAAYAHLPEALKYDNLAPMCRPDCWCLNRFKNGVLQNATNIMSCKRIEEAEAEERYQTDGLTHHATVPLRAGSELFGLLNIGSPHKKNFDEKELALLESVAFQIGTALKRIKLTQREQETALKEERNRLARDLHDSVNQLLFSLSLTARGGRELAKDTDTKETFTYIQDLAQEALNEMRALIWQLKPQGLEDGLIAAVQSYSKMVGLNMNYHVRGVTLLPGKVEETLWRIAQEAMMNCKKHSGQSEIDLTLIVKDNKVLMVIKDEGAGFHYQKNTILPSMGLKSMKERTEALKGEFHIQTFPNEGTMITIEIPV
ncbi:two-component system NarL family sensor kinase [Cytobacillus purgationiresistens]|uniref:histidine kinase n=2 Tax=Cytobacillus purgationiresistens TaxID=863449 RepID=A0ABU0ADN1_9BACI|nr:two-component system NarL family sensor kinase [Cytobacillus purgationiresistens]